MRQELFLKQNVGNKQKQACPVAGYSQRKTNWFSYSFQKQKGGVEICLCRLNQSKGVMFINIKQEINESKRRVQKLQNQITNCFDLELKRHLEYEFKQEALKLESYILLLELARKAGSNL